MLLAEQAPPIAPSPFRRASGGSDGVDVLERSWPLDHWRGRVALSEVLSIDERALARLAPELSQLELGKLAFLDVETTGLSGGTGTYAFLVGIGTIKQD